MARWGTDGERADADDSQAVAEGQRRRAEDDAVFERREVEWATTSWHALIAGAERQHVALTTTTGSEVVGRLVDQGAGWCQIDPNVGGSIVVRLDHVVTLKAAPRVAPASTVRRSVGSVVRRWARTRHEIAVELVDGSTVFARVGQVLSDALVLAAPHPRSSDVVSEQVTVPFSAVVCLRGPRLDVEP